MTKSKTNPKVSEVLKKAKKWQKEMAALRAILLECPQLTEELKWYQPCYTYEGSNIVILGGFKEYCGALFCKGALLKDPKGILIQQTANVQAARQMRFTNVQEIEELAPVLKTYVQEAIEAEKAGLKVEYKKTSEFKMPEELQEKFAEDPALKAAFQALTPGRQRGYMLYFSAAKQAKTRVARIEKYTPQILKGKGWQD